MLEITTEQFKKLYANHFLLRKESVMNLMPAATVKMRTGLWHLVSMEKYHETCEIGLAIHLRGGMTGGSISLQRLRLVMTERRLDWEIVSDYTNQTLNEIFDQKLIWEPEMEKITNRRKSHGLSDCAEATPGHPPPREQCAATSAHLEAH